MTDDEIFALIEAMQPREWRVEIDRRRFDPVVACSARAAWAAARASLLAARVFELDYGYRSHHIAVACPSTDERMFATTTMLVESASGVSTMF